MAYFWELVSTKLFKIMDKELLAYESPQVEVIAVEVEKGFAGSGDGYGGTDDPNTGA